MKTPKSLITIRTATGADGPAITGLFRQVFNQEMSPEQWAWKYRIPLYQRLFAAVAVDEKEGIVGHVGAIPLAGRRQEQNLPVWQLADAMVSPDYRGNDLFQGLLRHVGSSINALSDKAVIYAFAGPESTKIGLKKGILTDKAKVHGYLLHTATVPSPGFGWSLKPVSLNDNRLTALWTKQSGDLSVFTQRDDDYISWRYVRNPFHRYYAAVVRHLFRSVGWLIWTRDADGIKLVDYCVRASHIVQAISLLARLAAKGTCIRFWCPDSLIAAIRLPLTVEETLIRLMLLNTGDNRNVLSGMENDYHFTMGDADIY